MKTIRIETIQNAYSNKQVLDIFVNSIIKIIKADYEEEVIPTLYTKDLQVTIIKKDTYSEYAKPTYKTVVMSCICLTNSTSYYVAKSLDEIKEMIRCA